MPLDPPLLKSGIVPPTGATRHGSTYTAELIEGEWDRQGLISRGNGEYCIVIGWEYQDVYWCGYVGFIYTKDIEDGAEMAAESTPLDKAGAVSNWEGLEGGYYNWLKAEYETVDWAGEHVGAPVCAAHWPGEPDG